MTAQPLPLPSSPTPPVTTTVVAAAALLLLLSWLCTAFMAVGEAAAKIDDADRDGPGEICCCVAVGVPTGVFLRLVAIAAATAPGDIGPFPSGGGGEACAPAMTPLLLVSRLFLLWMMLLALLRPELSSSSL